LIANDAKVNLHFNNSNNEALLIGNSAGVAKAKELISFLDVPPRQFAIEAKIIQIDNQRINEIGLDWQNLLDKTRFTAWLDHDKSTREDEYKFPSAPQNDRKNKSIGESVDLRAQSIGPIGAADLLRIIQGSNIETITSVPRIVVSDHGMLSPLRMQGSPSAVQWKGDSGIRRNDKGGVRITIGTCHPCECRGLPKNRCNPRRFGHPCNPLMLTTLRRYKPSMQDTKPDLLFFQCPL